MARYPCSTEDDDDEISLSPPQLEETVVPMGVTDWLREPQFYQVALVYMTTRLFVNVSQAYITFYLQVTLQLEATYAARIPLVMFVAGFFVAMIMKSITKRIGRKLAFAISCIIGGAGCLWINFGKFCSLVDKLGFSTWRL